MEILKFILEGKTAFFRVPEVNTYYSFTFGNIHKIALLGIFGALLGYGGYGGIGKKSMYPEFYEKLHQLEVAVVPKKDSKGYIGKKIQSFNNSVGYASKEQGGNLIVKQQWLENPWWEIYLKVNDGESEKIKLCMLQKNGIFLPYLGSNDHPADITNVEIFKGEIADEDEISQIDSFFPDSLVELDKDEDEIIPFQYAEFLPVGLDKQTHMYQYEKFVFTNIPILCHQAEVVCTNQKNIIFF